MITIDNSVELMIKTYLKLPSRISGEKRLSRSKYEEKTKYFADLLDTIEEVAPDKLIGVELGDIEWYHELRNKLYHDGMGITVEKEKVQGYAELAKILFFNLFNHNVEDFIEVPYSLVGELIHLFSLLEQEVARVNTDREGRYIPFRSIIKLTEKGVLTKDFEKKFNLVRMFKNEVVHGQISPSPDELNQHIAVLNELLSFIRRI
ncbi:hypothetical protein [Methanobacterium formicicum]|uniref:Uncharacterized protein n=1 Tax=Methanobacterium formicicum TaxID=2162 RepID=A0A843AK23_METFO|nr:hypothetical protein [Methanobacterium formicicum]MBF4474268.1 hypothetical protein [Methanobacterium formicicum]